MTDIDLQYEVDVADTRIAARSIRDKVAKME